MTIVSRAPVTSALRVELDDFLLGFLRRDMTGVPLTPRQRSVRALLLRGPLGAVVNLGTRAAYAFEALMARGTYSAKVRPERRAAARRRLAQMLAQFD